MRFPIDSNPESSSPSPGSTPPPPASSKRHDSRKSILGKVLTLDWSPRHFAAVLAGLIFISFPGVLLGFKTFFFRDFGVFSYPLAAYYRDSFWRGELPLWNPLNNAGLPFLAQWNTLVLYPPSLLYLLLPLPWSLNLFCLGHLFLGGISAYFLAWH